MDEDQKCSLSFDPANASMSDVELLPIGESSFKQEARDRSLTPTSGISICSQKSVVRKLEWDSAADIGYAAESKTNLSQKCSTDGALNRIDNFNYKQSCRDEVNTAKRDSEFMRYFSLPEINAIQKCDSDLFSYKNPSTVKHGSNHGLHINKSNSSGLTLVQSPISETSCSDGPFSKSCDSQRINQKVEAPKNETVLGGVADYEALNSFLDDKIFKFVLPALQTSCDSFQRAKNKSGVCPEEKSDLLREIMRKLNTLNLGDEGNVSRLRGGSDSAFKNNEEMYTLVRKLYKAISELEKLLRLNLIDSRRKACSIKDSVSTFHMSSAISSSLSSTYSSMSSSSIVLQSFPSRGKNEWGLHFQNELQKKLNSFYSFMTEFSEAMSNLQLQDNVSSISSKFKKSCKKHRRHLQKHKKIKADCKRKPILRKELSLLNPVCVDQKSYPHINEPNYNDDVSDSSPLFYPVCMRKNLESKKDVDNMHNIPVTNVKIIDCKVRNIPSDLHESPPYEKIIRAAREVLSDEAQTKYERQKHQAKEISVEMGKTVMYPKKPEAYFILFDEKSSINDEMKHKMYQVSSIKGYNYIKHKSSEQYDHPLYVLPLQEAAKFNRPNLLERIRKREQNLKSYSNQLSSLHIQHRKKLANLGNSKHPIVTSSKATIPCQEMKRRTNMICNSLPEVEARRAQFIADKQKESNRLRLQLYKKNLQLCALSGKLHLHHHDILL